jgi:hypothetical protein
MLLPEKIARPTGPALDVIRPLGTQHGSVTALVDDRIHGRVVLRVWPGNDPRIETRAGTLAQLDHPALLRVFEHGYDARSDLTWMAVQRVRGLNLAQLRMALAGPTSPSVTAQLLHPVADALARVHARGLHHGRLSLRQIVLSRDADGSVRTHLLGLGTPPGDPNPDAGVFHPVGLEGPGADVCALAAIACWLSSGSGTSGTLWNFDRPRIPDMADPTWSAELGLWLAPGGGTRMADVAEALAERAVDRSARDEQLSADIGSCLEDEENARLPSQLGGTEPLRFQAAPLPPSPVEAGPSRRHALFGVALGMVAGVVATLGGLLGLAAVLR